MEQWFCRILGVDVVSLRNLPPWKPGESGNPNGRPRGSPSATSMWSPLRSLGSSTRPLGRGWSRCFGPLWQLPGPLSRR